MTISYDMIIGSFLSKVTEYDLLGLGEFDRTFIIEKYMKRAISGFSRVCKYDISSYDDENRVISTEVDERDVDEIVEIVSEGMLVQWMKPYVYRQENLENVLNTRDFTAYSPAELLLRISNAYAKVQKDYTNMVREYSYNHGDLSDLHI